MESLQVKVNDTTLILKSNNLNYEVVKNGFSWVSQGKPTHIFFQRKVCGKYLWFPKLFSSARSKVHSVCGNKIVSEFCRFYVLGKRISAKLIVTAEVLGNGKVDFSLEAENESGFDLKAVYFPRPFNAKCYDSNNSYSVDPQRQGFMIPDTWSVNRKHIFLLTKYWRKINTGDAYLGLFGRVCGKQGYSAVIEDSNDCTLFSAYGKKKAFLTASNWIGQLGKLGYKRTIHYNFMDNCNYVKIAKDFRQNEIKKGEFVTIDDKIKANPNVAKLIGMPVIHWRIMENNVESSGIYKATHIGETLHNTFAQTEEKFKKYKALGLDKAYVHTDGWGLRGYDNLHPYILPPNKKAGGYAGMKKLSETCESIGYEFGLHDQYRDYYLDSSVYDEANCIYDVNMKKSYCDYWAGGAHNWLDSTLAKPYVDRTYKELAENGVKIKGTYLDVWSIMWGDENYNPYHITTRTESILARGECFNMLRKQGLIMSSEELGCNMIKYLDLVHHAPYAVTPQGGGVGVGVPIPLANLVYHDCVFIPWHCEGKGGWGIPNGDSGKLHCILNGQTPYFNNSMAGLEEESDSVLQARINSTKEIAKINELVYNAEMVNHQFLDSNYRVQQTTFSNGVTITVDFDKDTYKIDKQ